MSDCKALVASLRKETPCYPDECEYCSAEGKCWSQRVGQACDAIEELLPYKEQYESLTALVAKTFCTDRYIAAPEAAKAEP